MNRPFHSSYIGKRLLIEVQPYSLLGLGSVSCSRAFPVSQPAQKQHLDSFDLNWTEPWYVSLEHLR